MVFVIVASSDTSIPSCLVITGYSFSVYCSFKDRVTELSSLNVNYIFDSSVIVDPTLLFVEMFLYAVTTLYVP